MPGLKMTPPRTLAAGCAALCLVSAAEAAPNPLAPGEAGVVGGWVARGARGVTSFRVEPVAEARGCLRLIGHGGFTIDDHGAGADKAAIRRVHRIAPGRYAIASVSWNLGGLSVALNGSSRQHGLVWTFTATPDVVTDIGVWPVASPFAERYVAGAPDLAADRQAAEALANGVGTLVAAKIVQIPVAGANDPCPSH